MGVFMSLEVTTSICLITQFLLQHILTHLRYFYLPNVFWIWEGNQMSGLAQVTSFFQWQFFTVRKKEIEKCVCMCACVCLSIYICLCVKERGISWFVSVCWFKSRMKSTSLQCFLLYRNKYFFKKNTFFQHLWF